jgi:molybdenum cofactor cytidylyltransferase/nicotine blue oxidoreductase
MSVWAGILAAGAGRRVGYQPKALLPLGERTFLETIATTARQGGAEGVAVVLGHHAETVVPQAETWCDLLVHNPRPEQGMASSAQRLAEALPPAAWLLLWPVDLPAIEANTVHLLLEAASAHPSALALVPRQSRRLGHPPLLAPPLVDALRRMTPTLRLDHFLRNQWPEPLVVDVDDEAIHLDVDNKADLAHLQQRHCLVQSPPSSLGAPAKS